MQVPLRTLQRWESKIKADAASSDKNSATTAENEHIFTFGGDETVSNHEVDCLDSGRSESEEENNGNAFSDGEDSYEYNCSPDGANRNSDNSDHDIDGDCQIPEFRELLYENCSKSVNKAVLALLDLYIKNRWTKASLRGTLQLLHDLLPEDHLMPRTIYKLFSYLRELSPPMELIKHYYCQNCMCYNGVNSKNINYCPSCDTAGKNTSFFFEININEQIKYMFEKRNLGEKLKPESYRENGAITDITDGSEYYQVNFTSNRRRRYDLTLMLNTDGLSLVKSSPSHCWPLMFVICELPEHLRDSFLVTIGIWYDKKCKPVMNTFLEPFCSK